MGTFVLIMLMGFLPAILAFLVAFDRFEAGERLIAPIAASGRPAVNPVAVFEWNGLVVAARRACDR